jgi:hypothetical protein
MNMCDLASKFCVPFDSPRTEECCSPRDDAIFRSLLCIFDATQPAQLGNDSLPAFSNREKTYGTQYLQTSLRSKGAAKRE